MKLIASILLATVLGFLLLMISPLIGGLLAFGIVTGCIFRGLFLLDDIHKILSKDKLKVYKTNEPNENKEKEQG